MRIAELPKTLIVNVTTEHIERAEGMRNKRRSAFCPLALAATEAVGMPMWATGNGCLGRQNKDIEYRGTPEAGEFVFRFDSWQPVFPARFQFRRVEEE